jgi:hypothetical protein
MMSEDLRFGMSHCVSGLVRHDVSEERNAFILNSSTLVTSYPMKKEA